jgi:hypothetical protein
MLMDRYASSTRLQQSLCQDGSVLGVALHPPGNPRRKENE